MAATFGQTTLGTTGLDLTARTNPALDNHNKPGGLTLAWELFPTNGGGATSKGGASIPAGVKYCDVGDILAKATSGTYINKYGPADTTATDGRQTVDGTTRGERFINDRLILETDAHSTQVGDAFEHGEVFKGRLTMGGTNQPTEAQVETMLPRITFITD